MQWQDEQRKPVEQRTLLHVDVASEEPVVVIATPTMLGWAEKYGHKRPLSLDATFGINKYGFNVTTLTAVDGQGRGVPILIAIMKSESAESLASVLSKFIAHVRERRANWRPSLILIDDSDAERKAIKCVCILPNEVWL